MGNQKKLRPWRFDLGSEKLAVVVECTSHCGTEGNKVPSAKLTVWKGSMYYFHLAPSHYSKVMFVLRDYSVGR